MQNIVIIYENLKDFIALLKAENENRCPGRYSSKKLDELLREFRAFHEAYMEYYSDSESDSKQMEWFRINLLKAEDLIFDLRLKTGYKF